MVGIGEAAVLASLIAIYCIAVIIYRLYFCPLSKFPGPRLAAATLWYEFYYEVIKEGQFLFKIQDLHKQYGPIVRINPFEVHIDDPDYHHVVFSATAVRNKDPYDTAQFGTGDTAFGTVDHKLHRIRRRPLNPFFSQTSIDRLELVLSSLIEKLCVRLDEARRAKIPLNMRLVYMCFTTDVVSLYSLNHCWNHLDSPNFSPEWYHMVRETGAMTKWTKQFPILYNLSTAMPRWIVNLLNPKLLLVLDMQAKLKSMVEDVKAGKFSEADPYMGNLPRTIFQSIARSKIPIDSKAYENMWQEGQNIIGAGSDSPANTLTVTTFHLLSNPDKLHRLRAELALAAQSLPQGQGWTLAITRQLPYLTAVVLEGLRLSYGTSSRSTRVAPYEDLRYQDWVIPAGTPMSMSNYITHHNENIFPNSHAFIPERWLPVDDDTPSLERYMVAFGKGSRQCLGMNLAKSEFRLVLATIFHRYQDMELFETNYERDVKLARDMFLPQPSKESRGMRVFFK